MDVIKALVDHENEEDIDEAEKVHKMRYVMINSSFALPAAVASGAAPIKKYFG